LESLKTIGNELKEEEEKKKRRNSYYHGIGFYSIIFLFEFCFKSKSGIYFL